MGVYDFFYVEQRHKNHKLCLKLKFYHLPKLLLFFLKTLILEVTKKQKLLNEEHYILFIDNTSINVNVNPDVNKNQDGQKQSIGRSK